MTSSSPATSPRGNHHDIPLDTLSPVELEPSQEPSAATPILDMSETESARRPSRSAGTRHSDSEPGFIGLLAFERGDDHSYLTPATTKTFSKKDDESLGPNFPADPQFMSDQETSNLIAAEHTLKIPRSTYWRPLWLSIACIASFVVFLLFLALCTVLLWKLSRVDHGYQVPNSSHYTWTYGPTAVLTLTMGLWKPVVYSCKLLQPWKQLQRGPSSAKRSLLLDYVSPLEIVSLFKSVHMWHVSVFSAITVGILLRIATIASTGLLIPLTTYEEYVDAQLEVLTEFKALNLSQIEGDPYGIDYEAYALIADNMPFPDGMQADLVYQRFALPSDSLLNKTNAKVRAVVDAFKPEIRCVPGNISITFSGTEDTGNGGTILALKGSTSWPSCPKPAKMTSFYERDDVAKFPTRQLFGEFASLNCSTNNNLNWLLVPLYDVRYNQSSIPGALFQDEADEDSGTWGLQVANATAAVCSISYSIKSARIMYDLAIDPPTIVVDDVTPEDGGRVMNDYPIKTFVGHLNADGNLAKEMFGNRQTNAQDLMAPNAFYNMMSTTGKKPMESMLANATDLAAQAATVLNYISVQIANRYIVSETSKPLAGQVSSVSTKLQISSLISWLMTGALLAGTALAITLIFTRPYRILPWSSGPISSTALVLKQSPDLNAALRHTGHLSVEDMHRKLQDSYFNIGSATEGGDPYTIHMEQGRPLLSHAILSDGGPHSDDLLIKWWRPIPLRPLIFALISFLPLALIITLEVLHHLSSETQGIASVINPNSTLTSLTTRILPSLILASVALAYGAVEFNISLFAPFTALLKGDARSAVSIQESLSGHIFPVAIYRALRHKQLGVALIMFSTFLGGFLTISVSGLYQFDHAPGSSSITLKQVDRFSPLWADSFNDDGGAAILFTDLTMFNVSYPPLSNAELALPTIELPPKIEQKIRKSSVPQFTVTLPAIRADLNCSVTPSDTFEMTTSSEPGEYAAITINGSTAVPPYCHPTNPLIEWSAEFNNSADSSNWVGEMIELPSPYSADPPTGCPSLVFVFGNYSVFYNTTTAKSTAHSNNTTNGTSAIDSETSYMATNLTVLTCYQLMTSVSTAVTLNLPNLTVLSAIPDESTVTYLSPDGTSAGTALTPALTNAFQYQIGAHFEVQVDLWDEIHSTDGVRSNTSSPSSASSASSSTSTGLDARQAPIPVGQDSGFDSGYDTFFSSLFHSVQGIPASVQPVDLQGPSPSHTDRLIKEVNRTYRRYMALVASRKMRIADSTLTRTYTGQWTNADRAVVRQDYLSKVVLQVLLAAMCACGIAAYLLVETREVLPRNPCSIAGTAGLVAGSRMCVPDDKGMRKEDIVGWAEERQKQWRGERFGMGWWEEQNGEGKGSGRWRFGIDVVGGESEKGRRMVRVMGGRTWSTDVS
ncbi:hypothetical protein K461DRAFT_34005 [Myriangium duriaei CBS 260.36]|uniref:Uncharacterized protein n=1 Tax=Myriangium duriaei CBS 260.36 TaxID=1168546 RepID=A0A9P4IZP9_9PEZI|nr:hypothetical protein K461DRAFT_34005 [Myriangium duriaei CBS 260.36]